MSPCNEWAPDGGRERKRVGGEDEERLVVICLRLREDS